MRIKSVHAHTLVEVMISLTIFTFMIASIYTTFIMSQRSLKVYSDNIAPKQELRKALVFMSSELREGEGFFIETSEHDVKLTFALNKYGEVKYSWSNTGDNAHKIIRTNYKHEMMLANNINKLSFLIPHDNEIIIELSAGKTPPLTLKQKIAIRAKTGLFGQRENEKIK